MLQSNIKPIQASPAIDHVVLIALDCVNPTILQEANTPNIDSLIESGSYTYDSCSVNPANTISAIPAILTGATQDIHQLYEWSGTLKAESIIEVLEESGHTCAIIGESENLGGYEATYNTGFDNRADFDNYYFGVAVNWIRQYAPFFMFIYDPMPDRVGHQYGLNSAEYLESIETADYQVGRIIDVLKEEGIFDETLIVITTDHSLLGTSHSRGPTFSIWRGPGIKQNYLMIDSRKYVSGYGWVSHSLDDVAPTICDLVGVRPLMDATGQSFKNELLIENDNESVEVNPPSILSPFLGVPEFETAGKTEINWISEKTHKGFYALEMQITEIQLKNYAIIKVPYNEPFNTLQEYSFYIKYTSGVPRFIIYLDSNHDGQADLALLSDYLEEGNSNWIKATGGLRWGWSQIGVPPVFGYGDPWKSLTQWKETFEDYNVLYLGIIYAPGLKENQNTPIFVDDIFINGVNYDIEPVPETPNYPDDSNYNSTVEFDNQDEWPMYRHDPARTGVSTSSAPDSNTTCWVINAREPYAISNGRLFTNNLCVKSDSAEGLWHNFQSGYGESVCVLNDKLYSVTTEKILCWNASNGDILWNKPVEVKTAVLTLLVLNDRVYVTYYDLFLCLDAYSGELIWEYETDAIIGSYAPSAYSKGKLYVVSSDLNGGVLYCIDTLTGDLDWQREIGVRLQAHPVITNGKIIVSEWEGNVYCLDEKNGELIWEYDTKKVPVYSISATSDKIYIGSYDHNLYCLKLQTGDPVWTFSTGGIIGSSPAIADGKIYFVSNDCILYCLDKDLGTEIWRYSDPELQYPGSYYSSPIIANGRLYVTLWEDRIRGKLICFGPKLNVEISPIFFDNFGKEISFTPDNWTIRFPDNSKHIVNEKIMFEGNYGPYQIMSVIFEGNELITDLTHNLNRAYFFKSDGLWSPKINCTLPTEIELSVNKKRNSNFVTMFGYLSCNEQRIPDLPIIFQYSINNGVTWNDITQAITNEDGEYSASWIPTATGIYEIKAMWTGNEQFPSSETVSTIEINELDENSVEISGFSLFSVWVAIIIVLIFRNTRPKTL